VQIVVQVSVQVIVPRNGCDAVKVCGVLGVSGYATDRSMRSGTATVERREWSFKDTPSPILAG
jgi:hypothetical protein